MWSELIMFKIRLHKIREIHVIRLGDRKKNNLLENNYIPLRNMRDPNYNLFVLTWIIFEKKNIWINYPLFFFILSD